MTSYIVQQLLNGIQLGSIYALIAVGYSMVYGVIKLINFAHADIFMVGAYISFFLISFNMGIQSTLPLSLWLWISLMIGFQLFELLSLKNRWLVTIRTKVLSNRTSKGWKHRCQQAAGFVALNIGGWLTCTIVIFPIIYFPTLWLFERISRQVVFFVSMLYVMALCALLGITMEKIAYRPLRYRGRLSALITALGVSLFLENFCSLETVFGSHYRAFPKIIPQVNLVYFDSLDIGITNFFLINVIVLAFILFGLWFLVEKTLLGKQMRAVAEDKKTASLMGIDVDKIISLSFGIGPALAGISGILFCINYGILQSPFLGFSPGIKAFIAAVLGGIGSLPGAVIGALIMGITEVLANSVDSNLGFAAAFMILIIILLIKPNGILGKEETEKV